MEDTAPASELERRKQLKLRLRRDLSIEPHKYEGRTYFVIKDPISLRYYRLKENEHYLLQFMDGGHTLEDAQKAYEAQYRPDRLKLEDVEGFAQQLINGGLAQNDSPRAGKQLFDAARRSAARSGCRPSPTSSTSRSRSSTPTASWRMLPWLGWIFTPLFLLASIVLMAQRHRPGGRQLHEVPRQAAGLPRVLQFSDRRLPVGRPGGGQGDPRVRPRPQLQEVRRRGPRDGLFAPLPVAGPLLQRVRRLDAAQQVAPHHHQRGRHLRRAGHRRHRRRGCGGTRRRSRSSTTSPWP